MAQHLQDFGKDARVVDTSPDTNYGSDTELAIEDDQSGGKNGDLMYTYAYVDFSAEGIASGDVDDAKVWVYVHLAGAISFKCRWHRSADFTEGSITWNNKPWPLDGTVQSSEETRPIATGWFDWDITDMIKDAIDNRSGIWIAGCTITVPTATSLNTIWFHSRERGEGYDPYIEINHTPAVGGNILKISGVDWANVKKACEVLEASISKVSGVSAN